MRRLLSSSKRCMTSSPAVTRFVGNILEPRVLTRAFVLQLLTGTQVASRQNNIFFYPASMYFSKWLAFIIKAHDFLAQMQRNSSEAYLSKNNMAEHSKSFQTFASVMLSKFSSDLLSKSFQTFSSDSRSKIFQPFAFKNFPAICFQNVASSSAFKKLSKFSSD